MKTQVRGRSQASTSRPAARRLSALALALALGAGTGGALADGLADEAELLFQLGTTQYQQADYLGALEHFHASNRLVPNRRVIYNIARSYEQLQRFADAHRYYVDALAGEDDPEIRRMVQNGFERVAPRVALLDVTTSPPGATLYLDRRDLGSFGRSPRPLAVAPGSYAIIAELDGYEPATSEAVQVTLGKRVEVTLALTRIVGSVRVGVTGADSALVRVDDERAEPACAAPCALKLPPGTHQLFYTRAGFQAPPQQVTVVARRETQVTAALSPVTGSVLVSTDEPGALVSIDGRLVGFTPTVLRDVPVGRRRLRIALHGFAPVEREIDVRPGQQVELPLLELDPAREVTAVSRYTQQIDDAPSSVSIVDGREIQALGYPTIVEALRGVRGVSLSNDRAYGSAAIRGLGLPNDYGNRVLVLSDGQALNDNLLNSSYLGSDGRVDLHDVDRIEIVRGPGSLLYGAGALSGVINLVTRPRDEPTSAHAGIGTYDDAVIHARAGFHYNLDQNRGVWASASAAQSDGFDLDVPRKTPPGDSTAHGVESFTSGGTAGRAWWGPATLQWFFHRRAQQIPTGDYATEFDNPRTTFVDTRMMTELRVEPRLTDEVQLMIRAHANRYVFHGLYAFGEGVENVEDYAGSWVGGEGRVVYQPSPRLRITAGGEVQLHPEATLVGDRQSAGTASRYLDAREPYSFAAGYALVEAVPRPWLHASAGARVDAYSTFGPIVVPRATVVVKPTPGGTLKLMGGRAFRAPSIYERVYNDGGVSEVPAVDNARGLDLDPESVYSGEVEYAQRFFKDWIGLLGVHLSRIEGIITSVPDAPGSPVVRYANLDSPVLVVGGDVEIRREWRRGWMFGATYGYQRTELLDPTLEDRRLVNAPEHLGSVRAVVPILREVASAGVRISVEAPRRIDPTSSDDTRAQVVADATISGDVRPFGLSYVIGLYNLVDRRYEVPLADTFASRTMPQNGRTFLLDVMATLP